ncbi:MAG: GGDEF domain-containing protein [Phycisphaeraceae bacterium]|nr:GGDEF domain-containing protein [Phycisphaeraceae bacterium]
MADVSEFYRTLLDHLDDGVYFVDRHRRITYWNKAAERLTGYAASEVVGRFCQDNLLAHVDESGQSLCQHGCPLTDSIRSGQRCCHDVYLRHKDGHRVPIQVRTNPIPGQDGQPVGAVEIFTDNSAKLQAMEHIRKLEGLAHTDPLTGMANRRYAESILAARLDQCRRSGWISGVLLVDVDHFKRLNDTFGHDIGDHALKMVAQTLGSACRCFDLVARWGGDEFLVLLDGVDHPGLNTISQRIRMLVERSSLRVAGRSICVTISAGATVTREGDDLAAVLKRADDLLYQSKLAGRNSVSVDQDKHAA